ncbi:bifunctional DNA primase/polymerase [Gemmatimonas sp.]|uniref:bifunctional DNA primase/polymerase n=1 Tax=Gemmatimonas sp. TaxID=1962908 RepID=UPI00286BBDA2|nr:bifunctional DNA primase/polymerase [Gemmatimonas sp.]
MSGAASQRLRQAAETWAKMGAHIFPLSPLSKVPLAGSQGHLAARADASPWSGEEGFNIGFLPASLGLIAIDVDRPQHWDDARRWGLLAEPTFEVTTPNGQHFYFRGRAPANGCPVDSLIVRAARGYTVLPPSVTADGVYSASMGPSDAIALPPAFADRLALQSAPDAARQRVAQVFSARRIEEGNRHPALCTLAGHLAARHIDELVATELVHAWNAQYCDPPKGALEVSKLVADIYAKERRRFPERAASFIAASHQPTAEQARSARRRPFGSSSATSARTGFGSLR